MYILYISLMNSYRFSHTNINMKLKCLWLVILVINMCGSSTIMSSELDSCSSKVIQVGKPFPFDTNSLKCSTVWSAHNFILRYAKTASDVWSFIFSFPLDIKAYAAIGFSKDGSMVGSSAMVGWVSISGVDGGIKEYYLEGKSPNQVNVDKGDLYYMNASIVQPNPTLVYMIFNLKIQQPSPNLIYAIGPSGEFPNNQGFLPKHSDEISTFIDYSKGVTSEVSNLNLRRSHGVLNMSSWSILMMIGSIIARYFKKWDPFWFYLHASIQTLGFVAGIVGILTGYALSRKLNATVTNHKIIAIFIFVLGLLQILAIKLRPGPQSKIRKYWNWYHHSLGRILIIFAVVNTFYGLYLGEEGSKWFLAYGVSVATIVVIALVLEFRIWIIARRETQSTENSSHPQSLEFSYHT